ncbi:MAG: hypothetical protein ACQKBY_08530 [Verrucomicrobiales bacterium]
MSFTVDQAFELVSAAHERGRLGHAFLVTGPKGCGKERLAARLADLLNGEAEEPLDLWGEAVAQEEPTLAEVEGDYVRVLRPRSKSRQISVEAIRGIEKLMQRSAPRGTWKIGVIVDADRMNESSENAFLKTLEEPPPGSLLLLLSGEPERLLPTIWSRCVHLPLHPEAGAERPEEVRELVPLLRQATERGLETLEGSLALKGAFEGLLAEHRARLEKTHKEAFKEEVARYGKATEGDWLEQREKVFEAMTSAEYLAVRGRLVDALLAWLGDLLRRKAGVTAGLAFPEEEALGKVAQGMELGDVLRRIEAVEELRRLWETNVTEALALEVCFMKAFGPNPEK